jgi:hypothetical protein
MLKADRRLSSTWERDRFLSVQGIMPGTFWVVLTRESREASVRMFDD